MQTFMCWVCDLIGAIISFLPSTPPELTMRGLILAVGENLPMIGTGIISEVYGLVQSILILFLIIKAFRTFQYFKVW
jgi:uncharacterized membrane protein